MTRQAARGFVCLGILALLCALTLSPAVGATWEVMTRDSIGRAMAPYLSSLGRGEPGLGAVRSEPFTLEADTVSFDICGWDGRPEQRANKNRFSLCDAETGLALLSVPPPNQDSMAPVRWDVLELIGKRVYFRAVDALGDSGFSWMGWQNVKVGERTLLGGLTPGVWPQGWTEETQPEGTSVDEWLHCSAAASEYAVEAQSQPPTWGVLTVNGERRTCEPYLSSLRGGEQGMGQYCSLRV